MINKEFLEPGIIGRNSNEVDEERLKGVRAIIAEHAARIPKEEFLENQLISLKLRMQYYLKNDTTNQIQHSGHFLKEILETLGIKNNAFAEYVGYQKSNLSSIFSGKRNMNFEFALKLYEIFGIEPELWLYIQIKNDLKKLPRKKDRVKKYDLKDLLDG